MACVDADADAASCHSWTCGESFDNINYSHAASWCN